VLLVAVGVPLPAVAMATGSLQPQQPEQRPTEMGNRSAVNGDRHDVDPGVVNVGPQMSPGVSAAVKSVFIAAKNKDWDKAKAKLQDAREVPSPTAFDLFEIEIVTGYIAINTGDHAGALASYKKTIADPLFAKSMKVPEQAGTLKSAIMLSNEAGDYAGAIDLGQKLIATGAIDETAAVALATAYFGTKNYVMAQTLAQKTIDAATAAGKAPNDTAVQIVAKSKAAMQ
jgi:tetratricopeptide (TPR) repeat protein